MRLPVKQWGGVSDLIMDPRKATLRERESNCPSDLLWAKGSHKLLGDGGSLKW